MGKVAEDRSEEHAEEERVPRYYVNSVGIQGGPIDLVLDLGYHIGQRPRETLARVVLRWEEARILRDFLEEALGGYEEHVGPVRDLPVVLSPAEEEGEGVSSGGDIHS